jgi:hypothetical protein
LSGYLTMTVETVEYKSSNQQKDARMLNELCLVLGDYLCIAVMLPKNLQANFPTTQQH